MFFVNEEMMNEFDDEKEEKMDSYHHAIHWIHPIPQSEQLHYSVGLWSLLWKQTPWESIHQSQISSIHQESHLELDDS